MPTRHGADCFQLSLVSVSHKPLEERLEVSCAKFWNCAGDSAAPHICHCWRRSYWRGSGGRVARHDQRGPQKGLPKAHEVRQHQTCGAPRPCSQHLWQSHFRVYKGRIREVTQLVMSDIEAFIPQSGRLVKAFTWLTSLTLLESAMCWQPCACFPYCSCIDLEPKQPFLSVFQSCIIYLYIWATTPKEYKSKEAWITSHLLYSFFFQMF